jgi:hypothetical protein
MDYRTLGDGAMTASRPSHLSIVTMYLFIREKVRAAAKEPQAMLGNGPQKNSSGLDKPGRGGVTWRIKGPTGGAL